MSSSIRSATSRILIAAIALILVCGSLLLMPSQPTDKRLTVAVPPVREQIPAPPVPQPPISDVSVYAVQDDGPNQIEVPQSHPPAQSERGALLQPTTQVSPPRTPDVDAGFFNEFEANLIFDDATVTDADDEATAVVVENESVTTHGIDNEQPINVAQSDPGPQSQPEPEQVPMPVETPGFGPIVEPDIEAEPEPEPEFNSVVPAPTIIRQEVDMTRVESALTDMRAEMSRITELKLKQAHAEQLQRIDRLERQIEELRIAQKKPKPSQVQVDLQRGDSADDGPDADDGPEKLEIYEPIEVRRGTIPVDLPNFAAPAIDNRAERTNEPMRLQRPAKIPEPAKVRDPIEYPPPTMDSAAPSPNTEDATHQSAPRYEFMAPQKTPARVVQPLTNLPTQPIPGRLQCTRPAPPAPLLNRLFSKRPTLCRHCGKFH